MLEHLATAPYADPADPAIAQLIAHQHPTLDEFAALQGADDEIRSVANGGKARERIQLDCGIGCLDGIDHQILAHRREHRPVEIDDGLAPEDGRDGSELQAHILGIEARKALEIRVAEGRNLPDRSAKVAPDGQLRMEYLARGDFLVGTGISHFWR